MQIVLKFTFQTRREPPEGLEGRVLLEFNVVHVVHAALTVLEIMKDLLVRAAVRLFVLVVPHGDSLFRTLLVRAVYGARVPRDRD